MIWKANKTTLNVYALNTVDTVSVETQLCHAPYFNIYGDGRVCLGHRRYQHPAIAHLKNSWRQWEVYFFNSFFSHTLGNSPVKGNIVRLWQEMVNSGTPFPLEKLTPSKLTIKDLLK